MATMCQMLANALDDIKCHMSATDEDVVTKGVHGNWNSYSDEIPMGFLWKWE